VSEESPVTKEGIESDNNKGSEESPVAKEVIDPDVTKAALSDFWSKKSASKKSPHAPKKASGNSPINDTKAESNKTGWLEIDQTKGLDLGLDMLSKKKEEQEKKAEEVVKPEEKKFSWGVAANKPIPKSKQETPVVNLNDKNFPTLPKTQATTTTAAAPPSNETATQMNKNVIKKDDNYYQQFMEAEKSEKERSPNVSEKKEVIKEQPKSVQTPGQKTSSGTKQPQQQKQQKQVPQPKKKAKSNKKNK